MLCKKKLMGKKNLLINAKFIMDKPKNTVVEVCFRTKSIIKMNSNIKIRLVSFEFNSIY
jgi:hypothetical protein